MPGSKMTGGKGEMRPKCKQKNTKEERISDCRPAPANKHGVMLSRRHINSRKRARPLQRQWESGFEIMRDKRLQVPTPGCQ